ncbi:TetR family transcriptional regulator [Mycolicibacterium flavescens]|uniref:TetR family transcriptional regulator n=1 Tax=Mycolicibacterium flavescens TaxID=1776 RepID=A0A1E3RLY7_MYCFV|nr:TetR family transcriptional regulator [Mycolicibacterium flavescens]MCV7281702.1 TetR family transcriptional regulator [Mycolicibacterium flavescens]ODQ90896.1 TetR family transcriptional regulator [Mycolicibacterium flavescens]
MPQRAEIDAGIADATLALLRSRGPRAVTVEAVAATSGIAKTTIYRRYRDRRDMLAVTLSRVTTSEPLGPDADPPDRLRWLISEAVKAIDAGIGFGGFAAMLTDEDPEFTKLFRRILDDQRAELESVIEASKADGSFRADLDGETFVDAVVGAHIAERARTGRLAPKWEARLFDLFWPIVKP